MIQAHDLDNGKNANFDIRTWSYKRKKKAIFLNNLVINPDLIITEFLHFFRVGYIVKKIQIRNLRN